MSETEPQEDWIPDPELGIRLPPRPEEPPAGACCGTGCLDCVMKVYLTDLQSWKKQVRRIKQQQGLG